MTLSLLSPPELLPTFRDPAGSLTLEQNRAIRTVNPSAHRSALDFVRSPFYLRAQQRGDIVASTILDSLETLTLIHPRIPVPSYPWEWTHSQWLAAAELTLTLAQEALADGWILKDATPLNILFIDHRPILVDVLSFERRNPGSSIWLAYGQYTRTFLLPLIMSRLRDWPLTLTFFRRDGYEPQELYQSMSWPQRLSPSAFWPITLPTWLDKKSAPSLKQPVKNQDPELTAHILNKMFAALLTRTRRAVTAAPPSEWSDYTSNLSHYTPEQSEQKRLWVQQVLDNSQPQAVLDIGANTGEFSALAAVSGAEVVALERDASAADRLFLSSRAHRLTIQTIHADLARPTPAAGWDYGEQSALLPRLEARFDLVMMLAVIHHLILMEQIPIPAIMSLMHRLTRRHLIVEWVPAADPMFQSLMRGRDSLYGALTDADLLSACAGLFNVVRRVTLGNGRILFLFDRI